MAGYRIPGPLRHDGEPIDEGTSALTRSPTPGPLGVDHCWPWGDRPDPELDYDSWGDRINREDLKIELAEEIAHLILDITGIFDPTPISDGNYALFCLAGGRWLDALVNTASIVPYIGDVSKIHRMLDYSRSIDKAIHLARIDITWRSRLRTVFTPLRSLLDKALAIEDELPDLTRKYLQEMRYEIDDFVTPHSMRELKPKAPANIEHAVAGAPSKKAKSPKKEKTESETSEDALKEQNQDSKIGAKKTTPDTDVVPGKNSAYDNALFNVDQRQTQLASDELVEAVARKRNVHIAKPRTDDYKFLEMTGADASAGGPGNLEILIRGKNPQRLTLMEEFLHGTQSKIWGDPALEVDNAVRNFREWHVRDFMNRHQRKFNFDADELSTLQTELNYYKELVEKGGRQ